MTLSLAHLLEGFPGGASGNYGTDTVRERWPRLAMAWHIIENKRYSMTYQMCKAPQANFLTVLERVGIFGMQ
jgi:hypothetical protein